MYTLAIADDQEAIRCGLANTIRKACPEITVVGVFKNGLETLEYLSSHPVDIIIADINMPHVTGLDIACHIYTHRLETKVILITGYKDFEYAKNAINYQVTYLLTKPFATAQLIDYIRKIEAEIEQNNHMAFASAKAYLSSWSLKRELLQLLYNGALAEQDELLCGREFYKGRLLEQLSVCEAVFTSLEGGFPVDAQAFQSLGETETEEYAAFFMGIRCEKAVFLLLFPTGEMLDVAQMFAGHFVHSVQVLYQLHLTASFKIFENMMAYLAFHKVEDLKTQYFDSLQHKKIEAAKQAVESLCSGFSGQQLQHIFNSIVVRLTDTYGVECAKNTAEVAHLTDSQIKAQLLDFTAQAVKNFSETHYILTQICNYIKENYGMPEMSLNHVADIFHINANYLGRIFKRETGKRFVDYLVNIRVEKAKALLQRGDLEVQDIAHAVGYNQVKYFRMVFKKHTGMSATQWIKIHHLGGLS